MFRYVIEYTANPWHPTNYDTVFDELKDAQLFLSSAVQHIGAKCKTPVCHIAKITLQQRTKDKWENL